jgi:hypothetical protein
LCPKLNIYCAKLLLNFRKKNGLKSPFLRDQRNSGDPSARVILVVLLLCVDMSVEHPVFYFSWLYTFSRLQHKSGTCKKF